MPGQGIYDVTSASKTQAQTCESVFVPVCSCVPACPCVALPLSTVSARPPTHTHLCHEEAEGSGQCCVHRWQVPGCSGPFQRGPRTRAWKPRAAQQPLSCTGADNTPSTGSLAHKQQLRAPASLGPHTKLLSCWLGSSQPAEVWRCAGGCPSVCGPQARLGQRVLTPGGSTLWPDGVARSGAGVSGRWAMRFEAYYACAWLSIEFLAV